MSTPLFLPIIEDYTETMQVEINRKLIEDAFRDDARLGKRVFDAIGNFTKSPSLSHVHRLISKV
jgi:hypothetical protein